MSLQKIKFTLIKIAAVVITTATIAAQVLNYLAVTAIL